MRENELRKAASFLQELRQHGCMKTTMTTDSNAVRDEVRKAYGKIAGSLQNGCCSDPSSSGNAGRPSATAAEKLGYNSEEIAATPEGADLGLGCGNPQAIASLKP